MKNHISRIKIPSAVETVSIELPVPEENSHTITVICGPNGSGKSYILTEIQKELNFMAWPKNTQTTPSRSQTVRVEFTSKEGPALKMLQFGNTWHYEGKIGIFAIGVDRNDTSNGQPPYREATNSLFESILINGGFITEDYLTEWRSSGMARLKLLASLSDSEDVLYPAKDNYGISDFAMSAMSAQLAFRRVKDNQLELVLVHGDGATHAFSTWSAGQRTLFTLLLLHRYTKPDVVLLDEIETHLHPTYISQALEQLKLLPGQTILTSHHPHLIFTHHVDQVVYIESERPNGSLIDISSVRYRKSILHKAPKRKISTLTGDIEKIASTYRLFDLADCAILQHANQITRESQILILEVINKSIDYSVAEQSPKSLPDRQTRLFSESIKETISQYTKNTKVSIFDIGSGFGRLILENEKISDHKAGYRIEWTSWEPSEKNRQEMTKNVDKSKHSIKILSGKSEFPKRKIDIAVIANVLHELDFNNYTQILLDACASIKSSGAILVLEIFPLLNPEKTAVPISEIHMKTLFDRIGFDCFSSRYPLHGSSVYCIIAHPRDRDKLATVSEIEHAIRLTWMERRREALSQYSQTKRLVNLETAQQLLGELMTIATIDRELAI